MLLCICPPSGRRRALPRHTAPAHVDTPQHTAATRAQRSTRGRPATALCKLCATRATSRPSPPARRRPQLHLHSGSHLFARKWAQGQGPMPRFSLGG
eukprot:scaffold4387_cov126-Isochrysis_galbana.AAC.2